LLLSAASAAAQLTAVHAEQVNTSQGNLTQGTQSEEGHGATTNLANTLFITFFAVFMGFACVRLGLVVPPRGDMRALGFFVGQIAFPLLVFRTVATARFGEVNMMVILACTFGKLAVLALTFAMAFVAYKTKRSYGQRWLTASIFSFFVTASNDFAIGMPVVEALYAGQHMMAYIAANALVNSAVLTPIAMVLLAIGSNLQRSEVVDKSASGRSLPQPSTPTVVLAVLREILLNPVIVMTIAGFVFQFGLGFTFTRDSAGDLKFFSPLQELVDLITQPFGMCALFLTGTSLRTPRFQFWPVLLVVMKVVLCAWASYAFALALLPSLAQEVEERLTGFSFLYGMIPTSSAPLVFALQFDPSATELVATAILFGLVLAGPMMFGSAVVLQGVRDFPKLLVWVELQTAVVALCGGLLLLVALLVLRGRWGYACPVRVVVVGVIVVTIAHELITLLMNPAVSPEPCRVYNEDPFASRYGFMLGMLQTACRVLILALTAMALFDLGPRAKSPLLGLGICATAVAVGVVLAFFTVPHTIAEMCEQPRMEGQVEVEYGIPPVANVVADTLFLGLFCLGGGIWAVRHSAAEHTEGEQNAQAPPAEEIGVEEAAAPESRWLSQRLASVTQGLAFTQIVLVFLQLVNTAVVRAEVPIAGSFQMMLLLEMMLQHGFPVVLVLLLVSTAAFCEELAAAVRMSCPWLFWFSACDEEQEAGKLMTGQTTASKLDDFGHGDLVVMSRLSSLAGGFAHADDLKRNMSFVSRRASGNEAGIRQRCEDLVGTLHRTESGEV